MDPDPYGHFQDSGSAKKLMRIRIKTFADPKNCTYVPVQIPYCTRTYVNLLLLPRLNSHAHSINQSITHSLAHPPTSNHPPTHPPTVLWANFFYKIMNILGIQGGDRAGAGAAIAETHSL